MKKEQNRALNAFAAMESLPDDLILDAERALTEAENGYPLTPAKGASRFSRFLNSGWGVAAIAGLVSVVVLMVLIRVGQEPPAYAPPVKPAGSTIEMSDRGVNFTISTEVENYPDGTGCITVIMTGKTPGESISMQGGWHLERLTEEGAEAVEISYTEEAIESSIPDKDGYATIKKAIYGTYTGGGFPSGTYRLHATKHDGKKYVSVAWCTFTVGETEDPTPEYNTEDPTADNGLVEAPFRVMLLMKIYTTQETRLQVFFRAGERGVPLSRGDGWSVYRMEDGKRIHIGSQTAEYAIEGAEVGPEEFAEETLELSISRATGGACQSLPAGSYELVFDSLGNGVVMPFTVVEGGGDSLTTDDPHQIVERGTFFWADGDPFINMTWGVNFYPVRFTVEDESVDFSGLTTGDVVEMVMGEFVEETFPAHGYLYGIRKICDGSPSDLPAAMVEAMEDMDYKITEAKESE